MNIYVAVLATADLSRWLGQNSSDLFRKAWLGGLPCTPTLSPRCCRVIARPKWSGVPEFCGLPSIVLVLRDGLCSFTAHFLESDLGFIELTGQFGELEHLRSLAFPAFECSLSLLLLKPLWFLSGMLGSRQYGNPAYLSQMYSYLLLFRASEILFYILVTSCL